MSIKKNFIYNITYQILIVILPLITTPYISRTIGAEGIGLQSYTYSIVSYFILFAMLGINNYGNRSIAIVRDNKEKLSRVFISIYIVQLILSMIMILLYSLYIIIIVKENKTIFIIQLIYLISALLDINWFFFGMEQFKLTVVRNTVIKLLSVMSIFIFVKHNNALFIYSLILALGTLISQMILWLYIHKYIKFIKPTTQEILSNIKPILILFIPVISISIYRIMAKIMLGSMSSMTQVGFYENCEKIINIPMGIIVALGTVMLPRMSNIYANNNNKEGEKYISLSLEFIMFMANGAMFGLIGISPILIPIFLGEQFMECIRIVSLLSITILFLAFANVIRTQFLIPKKKDSVYIVSTILGAIISLISNLLLISKYGAIGAAIGTICSEAMVAIYQIIMVRRELDIVKYFKRTIFYIVPGIIMCIIIRFIGYKLGISIVTAIIQFIIGGVIYCVISLIYMIAIKNDIIINSINIFKDKVKFNYK